MPVRLAVVAVVSWRIIEGDCIEAMAAMDECSVDAIVCDPPYDLTAGKARREWRQQPQRRFAGWTRANRDGLHGPEGGRAEDGFYGDTGGASRFFYCPKADGDERHAGLSVMSLFTPADSPDRNDHPTVKPIALMQWLVRLVTPPGGLVLDPFAGSGTTGIAAVLKGFEFVDVEREMQYARIARARLAHWSSGASEGVA